MAILKNYKLTVVRSNLSFPITNEGTINFWRQRLDDIGSAMASNPDHASNFIDWDTVSTSQILAFLTRPDEHTLVLNRVFADDDIAMGYFSKHLPLLTNGLEQFGYVSTFEVEDFDENSIGTYPFSLRIH